MTQEEFIKEIEAIGFVNKEPILTDDTGDFIYIKQIGTYLIMIKFYTYGVKILLLYYNMVIARFEELVFNDKTISILKNLLKGFDDKNDEFEELKELLIRI